VTTKRPKAKHYGANLWPHKLGRTCVLPRFFDNKIKNKMKKLVNTFHYPGLGLAGSLPKPMPEKIARQWLRKWLNASRCPPNTCFWYSKGIYE